MVGLEQDMRADDAEVLISAINQLRGVLFVKANVSDPGSYLAEERVRRELGSKLLEVLRK
jgi:hypothetical protein